MAKYFALLEGKSIIKIMKIFTLSFPSGSDQWLMCCSDDKAPEQPHGSLFKAGINDLRAFFSLAGTKHCPSIVLQLCLREDRQYTGFCSCSTSHSFSFISLHFVMRISRYTFSFTLHLTWCFCPWFNLKLLCFLYLLKTVNSTNVLRRKIGKKRKLWPSLLSKPSNTYIQECCQKMVFKNDSCTGITLTGFTWGLDSEQIIT